MSDVLSCQVKVLTSDVYVLSLSAELLKNIRRIDQGFPHIGVCPSLAPHLVSSCLGLFSDVYVYVLSALYYHVDVIANFKYYH